MGEKGRATFSSGFEGEEKGAEQSSELEGIDGTSTLELGYPS